MDAPEGELLDEVDVETARTNVALASALSALVAVGASLLALAVREVFFGEVPAGDLDSAVSHFTIVAALFVWPPLTVIVFLIGIARASDDSAMRIGRAGRTGVATGAALGSLGLAAF